MDGGCSELQPEIEYNSNPAPPQPENENNEDNAAICSVCNGLELHQKGYSVSSNRYLKFTGLDLQTSALARVFPCPSCAMLWNLTFSLFGKILTSSEWSLSSLETGPLDLFIWRPGSPLPDELRAEIYSTPDDLPAPWYLVGQSYHVSEYGLSASCVSLARQWIDECTRAHGDHTSCVEPEVPILPTRVVDVEVNGTDCCRLHVTTPGERSHYFALSHCWGGSIPYKTTTGNFSSRLQSLPTPLPQTFADAVAVTRALGFRYLWIDALCILQDSTEDWRAEAGKMAEVYSNAYLTISADAAKDSYQGFLRPPSRSVPTYKTWTYDFPILDGKIRPLSRVSRRVHIRTRGDGTAYPYLPFHYWEPWGLDYISRPEPSKLATRGWVLQERLLAPRSLHFGGSEMAYACRSLCICECSAKAHSWRRQDRKDKVALYPELTETWSSDSEQEFDGRTPRIVTNWRVDVVQRVARLDFTVPSDRLPAVAGLAKSFEKLREGDQYMHGLWRETLAGDLLWGVFRSKSHSSERLMSKEWPVPSWSWASVTGGISYRWNKYLADFHAAPFEFHALQEESPNNSIPPALIAKSILVKVKMAYHQEKRLFYVVPEEDESIRLSITWNECNTLKESMVGESFICMVLFYNVLDFMLHLVDPTVPNGPYGPLLRLVDDGPNYHRVGLVNGEDKKIVEHNYENRAGMWIDSVLRAKRDMSIVRLI